jgi:hypothetical protein
MNVLMKKFSKSMDNVLKYVLLNILEILFKSIQFWEYKYLSTEFLFKSNNKLRQKKINSYTI